MTYRTYLEDSFDRLGIVALVITRVKGKWSVKASLDTNAVYVATDETILDATTKLMKIIRNNEELQ